MGFRSAGGNRIVLYAEKEIRGDQHGLKRELNPLLRRLVIFPCQVDEFEKSSDFISGNRAAVGATGQRGDYSVDAGRARVRIADQNLLAARLFDVSGERSDELDGIEKLVLLVAVGVFWGEVLHEVVVNKTGLEDMIAFGEIQPHLFFRIWIEVNQFRRLGLHQYLFQQNTIHPETQHHRLGIRGSFTRQSETDDVLSVEIDAVSGFNVAEIRPADVLVFRGVRDFDGFLREWISADRTRGDGLGGVQIVFHQHWRNSEHLTDVVEAVTGIFSRKILVGPKIHTQQIADGVGVLVAVQPVGGDAS